MAAKKDPLLKIDVAKRRGVVQDADGDSWDAVLVRGSMDEIAGRLVGAGMCGAVRKDVTAEAIKGTLKQPAGRWTVLVKIRGQEWVSVVGSRYGDFDFPEELAKATGLEVMRLGHEDTSGARYFTYYKDGKAVVDFESTGLDGDETRFVSDRHKKGWLKGFADEGAVRDRLVEEFGAYVPMVWAGGAPGEGKIGLYAWHEDVVKRAGNVERVDLAVFGPAEALEENPAGRKLKEALQSRDVEGVNEAIAAGADLRFMPEGGGAPLDYAIGIVGWGEVAKAGIEMVKALLEAGADANGGGQGENPPVFRCVDELSAMAVGEAVELIGLLVKHGADVDRPAVRGLSKGQTALHDAAIMGKLPLVKRLVALGADVRREDGRGDTPRRAAERTAKNMGKMGMGDEGGEQGAVVEFLKRAERGEADVGDVEALVEEDLRKERRRRRKAKVAMAELGEMFKALGRVMEGNKGRRRERAAARVATLAQPAEVHVRRNDGAKWRAARKRDEAVRRLGREGYEAVGTFVVEEMPAVRMAVMVHPGENVYGVVGEAGGTRWVDLVRYHADGSAVTVTNAETRGAARAEVRGKKKVRMPGKKVGELVAAMRRQRPPKAGVARVTGEQFAERFERYYAEEMRARKRLGRKAK